VGLEIPIVSGCGLTTLKTNIVYFVVHPEATDAIHYTGTRAQAARKDW
jgi:hypothetical protein